MEEFKIDAKKPLWWVLLVLFCMVTIYFIGISHESIDHLDDLKPSIVENFKGVRT